MTSNTAAPGLRPLARLREILNDARDADDAERIHAALVEVVDGLISRAEQFERFMLRAGGDLEGALPETHGGPAH